MSSLWKDIIYSIRVMLKNPAFSAVAVFTLAIGISANSAVFSVVNAVLLGALPYREPGQLVMLWEDNLKMGLDQFPASYPNFVDYKDQSQSFESFAAFRRENYNLTGTDQPVRLTGASVSEDFFPLLGVSPLSGHSFSQEEFKAGNYVMISYGLWQSHFGGDRSLVGRTLMLNGKPYTVIGVMPAGFQFPGELFERVDFWVPLRLDPEEANNRASHGLFVISRLKPQVPVARAEAEVEAVAGRLQQQYQASNSGWGAKLTPLREQIVGDARPSLLILLGAVGLVLLIACANVANLLIARAAGRQKEIAIRMAIGASRGRMIQQLLTESLVLAVISSLLGLLLAFLGIGLLKPLIPSSYVYVQDVGVNGKVLGFTLLVSVLTAVIFGLLPALQATKPDIIGWIKEGSGKTSGGVQRRLMRKLLVVSEVALALVLLIGASLLIKSFMRLQQVDPGFRPDNILTMSVTIPAAKYPDSERQRGFFRQVLQQIQAMPGVKSAAGVTRLPLGNPEQVRAFLIEGRPPLASGEQQTASYNAVSPDYFNAMSIPIAKGRAFTERDAENAPLVAVINQTMARRYFPGEEPLGKHLILKKGSSSEIVGVVGDVKGQGLDAAPKPGIYVPYLQAPSPSMTLVVRSVADPLSLTNSVRGAVRNVDSDQPVDNVSTMEEVVRKSTSQQRLNMLLLTIFAAVAVTLASVGVYSVMAHSVRQRKHELGIRVALGARPGHILSMVVGEGMTLTLIGVGIGLVAAFFLTRLISSLLYDVNAVDPLLYLGATLLLAVVAIVACYVPARRATRIDPMLALRVE